MHDNDIDTYMGTYWLKALGGGPRVGRMPDDWRSVENGLFERAITFGHNSSLEPGDKIVLYAAGWGAFFAIGSALSYPYKHDDGKWGWRVDVALDHAVSFVHHGVPLKTLNVDGRDLRVSMKRRSHIRLSDAEYEEALQGLRGREEELEHREH